MDKNRLRRRQLLWYLGLGVVGAGTASVAFSGFRWASSPALEKTRTSPVNPSNEIAAIPANAQPLPEFQGISEWLNSPPLTTHNLKGNVVLVQFWTFACINCQRTLPFVTRWHQQFAAQGLKVIGIHTPEFAFERQVSNITKALKQHKITYPIPIDNEYKTWNAYQNSYWPHLYLADRQGNLRYDHIGEGAYDETEQMIRQLLEEG